MQNQCVISHNLALPEIESPRLRKGSVADPTTRPLIEANATTTVFAPNVDDYKMLLVSQKNTVTDIVSEVVKQDAQLDYSKASEMEQEAANSPLDYVQSDVMRRQANMTGYGNSNAN